MGGVIGIPFRQVSRPVVKQRIHIHIANLFPVRQLRDLLIEKINVGVVVDGILGGTLGSKVNKKIDDDGVNKLFIALMIVIIFINIYNAVKFGIAS